MHCLGWGTLILLKDAYNWFSTVAPTHGLTHTPYNAMLLTMISPKKLPKNRSIAISYPTSVPARSTSASRIHRPIGGGGLLLFVEAGIEKNIFWVRLLQMRIQLVVCLQLVFLRAFLVMHVGVIADAMHLPVPEARKHVGWGRGYFARGERDVTRFLLDLARRIPVFLFLARSFGLAVLTRHPLHLYSTGRTRGQSCLCFCRVVAQVLVFGCVVGDRGFWCTGFFRTFHFIWLPCGRLRRSLIIM